MEKVIATALLIIGGVTAAAVVMFVLISANSVSSQSVAESQQEASVRNRTSIEVIAVAARPGGRKVDAWVKNVGTAPIAAIEKSSLFLSQPGTRYDALTYNNDGMTSKTWSGDLKEAGLPWNKGDTLHITVNLCGADRILSADDFVLLMSTPNGKASDKVFGSYSGAPTACLPYLWYFHSETSSINSIDYYQLKNETPADGTATTISSTFAPATTGRVRPASNNGKFVFPLAGVSQIPAMTWTATYRAKRDKVDGGGGGGPWWNTSWQHRRKITFDNSASTLDLLNFPVLVSLTDPANIDYAKTQNLGEDIRFIDGDGSTELDYEIETWDEAGTSTVWVRVPQIDNSSSTDFIWMYYNNTGALDAQDAVNVWDTSYKGVWHLEETVTDEQTSGTHIDSTSNPNDGAQRGNDDATGQISNGQVFDGTNDYIDAGNHASVDIIGTQITVEAWIKADSWAGSWWQAEVVGKHAWASGGEGYVLRVGGSTNGNVGFQFGSGAGWQEAKSTGGPMLTGQWYYLVGKYDGSNLEIFIDGISKNTKVTSLSITSANINVNFGRNGYANGRFFTGTIDEVRISNVARSDDWIVAQHKSMDLTFNTFAAEEAVPEAGVNLTVHADLDVLVRQADGGIRSTLSTNVANSGIITDITWQTFTANYAFPGYTVVDQTDYLEFDLFADATANTSDESVMVDFRIDDAALAVTDQTRVQAP